jgi:uncharacterized protein (TIGR02266 family)
MPAAPGVVVRVKFKNRRQLKQVWLKDISKGGIFLHTDTPLEVSAKVSVILDLPDGTSVEVTGNVVHVISPEEATGHLVAGMGVQFVDLTPAKREMVEQFLTRHRTLLPATGARGVVPPPPAPALENQVQTLRRLIWLSGDAAAFADADYYAILGVPATATTEQIRDACGILQRLLDPQSPPEGLEDTDRTRIEQLYATLAEIEVTLVDPQNRLQYDSARLGLLR